MKHLKKKWFSLILLLPLLIALVYFFDRSQYNEQTLTLPYNVSFVKPQGWKVSSRNLPNQPVITNNMIGDSRCYLDVFAVRPDRDYTFEQWLGTTLANQEFIKTAQTRSENGYETIQGSYKFYGDHLKTTANFQRKLLKKDGTLVDVQLSYLGNESCKKTLETVLSSLKF